MLRRSLLCAAIVALGLVTPGSTLGAQSIPVPVAGPEPALTRDLDAVLALSPPDTCLTVSIDATIVFDHRGTDLQSPASTQKLITAAAALDDAGGDWRYRTEALATGPVANGTLTGNLVVVGSGDPGLVTAAYRARRGLRKGRPKTLLDDLADQVVASGISRIEGSVLADESRYDGERGVSSWPARHTRDNLAGPLSAVAVDKGYQLRDEDGRLVIIRSLDPAADAAAALTWLLSARGVTVVGSPAAGTAPDDAMAVAAVSSVPLEEVVGDMLARSDNTAAEMVLKEIGARSGEGSTAGGASAVAAWLNEQGLAEAGAAVVDGSGLDTGNQVSCQELVGLLDVHRVLDPLLPVAGESGTLARRFVGTAAEGNLRAKTGSLNEVTSLAGHVDLPDGGTATFAYIANGEYLNAPLLRAQDYLAQILATYLPPCPAGRAVPIIDPTLARLGQLGVMTGAAAAGASPVVASSLAAMEARAPDLVDRCSAEGRAAVVLAPTGRAN